MTSTMDDISKEEYKQIFSLAIQIEQRMLQLFMLSVAVSVSLLSGLCALIFSSRVLTEYQLISTFLVLVPNLITMSSFTLILSHRMDLVRLASYKWAYYEDNSDYAGWAGRLDAFRKRQKSEAHDPIPLTYWSILIASILIFCGLIIINNYNLYYSLVAVALVLFMSRLHYKWSHAIGNLSTLYEVWKEIKSEENKMVKKS